MRVLVPIKPHQETINRNFCRTRPAKARAGQREKCGHKQREICPCVSHHLFSQVEERHGGMERDTC